ncbi:MAG: putative enoyl-CoA hydratase/carnitine racemase match [Frankiales bacterium]|nr:putative enoyl-CoA hydratase/carnitine racemase match [Frankiales bacterium]
MDLDHLHLRTSGGVAEIRLSRPRVRNVLSSGPHGTRAQIAYAVSLAEQDPDVGAILLTAAGGTFCAGGDLTGGKPRVTTLEDARFLEEADAFHTRLRESSLPIIAAVRGNCLGAGMLLASSCDLVVAAESASFGLPEGRLGLVGASYLVPIVGRQWAKFLIMTGESVTAERARDIGLVLEVVPDGELELRAGDLARRLSRMPKEALLLNKQAIDAVADLGGDAAGRAAGLAHDAITLSMASRATAPDGRSFREILAKEGLKGLKPAREAQWTEPWLQ